VDGVSKDPSLAGSPVGAAGGDSYELSASGDQTNEVPSRSLRIVTLTLAIACGLTVANLYYAQPLLDLLANSFHVSQGTAAIVVTATQLGYAVGLALLLPLGDLLENRKLASRTLLGTAVALVIAAFAPGFGVFLAMSVLIGLTSVVAQILVPLAAQLAPPEQRGQFVGKVMSGLLLGILLARTVASLVAAAWGWRSIFLISAVLMVATSIALARVLPRHKPPHTSTYWGLLRSVGHLAKTEPVLRNRAMAQACMFGAFTTFWTAITYELIAAHGLTQVQIGIFALVGAAGAAAAPIAGKVGDLGHGHHARAIVILIAIFSMILAGVGASSIWLLAAAGVLLDLAVQGHQVLTQREIYGLNPEARARINTVYMCTVFLFAALCSAISGWLFVNHGWDAVTRFAGGLAVGAALVWTTDHVREYRRAPSRP
jgi:predicted MFS family arabinose efflux permease